MYNKCWIMNPLTKEYKIWSKFDDLPENWEYGKYQTSTDKVIEQRKLFFKSTLGKIKYYNPITNVSKFISPGDSIPEGFRKGGKPLSTTGKQKLSEFHKQKR